MVRGLGDPTRTRRAIADPKFADLVIVDLVTVDLVTVDLVTVDLVTVDQKRAERRMDHNRAGLRAPLSPAASEDVAEVASAQVAAAGDSDPADHGLLHLACRWPVLRAPMADSMNKLR